MEDAQDQNPSIHDPVIYGMAFMIMAATPILNMAAITTQNRVFYKRLEALPQAEYIDFRLLKAEVFKRIVRYAIHVTFSITREPVHRYGASNIWFSRLAKSDQPSAH